MMDWTYQVSDPREHCINVLPYQATVQGDSMNPNVIANNILTQTGVAYQTLHWATSGGSHVEPPPKGILRQITFEVTSEPATLGAPMVDWRRAQTIEQRMQVPHNTTHSIVDHSTHERQSQLQTHAQLGDQRADTASETLRSPPAPKSCLCIICKRRFSSRGVCKRHIEDQHETPTQRVCLGCGSFFAGVWKVKRHMRDCPFGRSGHAARKPGPKKAYGCEFTGLYHATLNERLEHLLDLGLCANALTMVAHQRLRLIGLLQQPGVRSVLRMVHEQRFGAGSDGWMHLSWPTRVMQAAIPRLECGVEHFMNGTSSALQPHEVQPFLEGLLEQCCNPQLLPPSNAVLSSSAENVARVHDLTGYLHARQLPQQGGYHVMAEHESFALAYPGIAPSTSNLSTLSWSDASSTICPSLWSVSSTETFDASSNFHEIDWTMVEAKGSDWQAGYGEHTL